MNPSDLLKGAVNMNSTQFERKLNSLVRNHSRYKNLDEGNKKVIMEVFKKHRDRFRTGIGLSYSQRTREMSKIKATKGVTKEDLKDIKEIIDGFKSR